MTYPANRRASLGVLMCGDQIPYPVNPYTCTDFIGTGFPICHLLEADLWKPVPIKSTDVVYRDLMGTGFPDLVDEIS